MEDWRALYFGAKALFETGDFATGARFVAAIAEVAEELGHSPLLDVRPDTVTVQVLTVGVGLSDLDLQLAQRISALAGRLGLTADPSAVQQLEVRFDAENPGAVLDFWRAALGYVPIGPDVMVERNLIGPNFTVGEKPYVSPRNRIHVDVCVPHDVAEERVAAVLSAGGRMLSDRYAPAYWSLIDVEGNVVDIATWQGRDEDD